MFILAWPAAALGWLGRHGTRAVAASIFLGVALPPLAAWFKPFVTAAIFMLLVLAFLRVDPAALRGYLLRPWLVLAATAWIMLVSPVVFGLTYVALGLREQAPGLFLGLIFQSAAAPIMSAPAFAALLGLDVALSLATLMLCMAVTPITAPFFAHLFAGETLAVSAGALGVKLLLLLLGSGGLAMVLRWRAGPVWIGAQKTRIDGLTVVTLFVFAVALMDGVAALTWNRPLFVLGIVAAAFAIAFASMLATTLIFLPAGKTRALALGLAAANRNMGLMLAASGGVLPDLTWLYSGLAQFPIYLLPQMLQPLARRLNRPPP